MTNETRRAQWREAQRRRRLDEPLLRPPVAECGTPSGAKAHRRYGERPCDACRIAENAQRQANRLAQRTKKEPQ